MFAYKTNSADYLDYVASVKSREQIKADPDLCLLLENEYIKDNMEMALLWNAAKYGDYQDKYNFMEYFFCNGPQLDADTILHYRMKAYNDPVCMEIAYTYLSDTNTLSDIRKDKYNKDSGDCFNNPCFYMGKFSAMMGSCGDVRNTRSAFNMVSRWVSACRTQEKKAKLEEAVTLGTKTKDEADKQRKKLEAQQKAKEAQAAADAAAPVGSKDKVKNGTVKPKEKPDNPPAAPAVGGMRSTTEVTVIPSMSKGWKMMWANITQGDESFCNELVNHTKTARNAKRIGDKMCQPISQMLDLVTKANIKRQMGDCARLWSQVRRLHLFSSENKYGPIVASQIVSDTNTDGTKKKTVSNPQPKASDASANIAAAKKANSKIKKKKKKQDKYAAYRDPNSGAIDLDKLQSENPALYSEIMEAQAAAYKYEDKYGILHDSKESRDQANRFVPGVTLGGGSDDSSNTQTPNNDRFKQSVTLRQFSEQYDPTKGWTSGN